MKIKSIFLTSSFMNFKIKYFTQVLTFLVCGLLSGCASFHIKKDAAYNQFSDIKKCEMKANWVNVPGFSTTDLDFNLVKLTRKNQNPDYFLRMAANDSAAFSIGHYVIFVINGSQKLKLRTSYFAAKGTHTYLDASINAAAYPQSALSATVTNITKRQAQLLANANSIYFSVQAMPHMNEKSISGTFSQQNMLNMHQFASTCMK